MAVAAVRRVVAAVAGGVVEGAAGVWWASAAAESDNQVTSGASDEVEVLSCVLVTVSFGLVDSEGKSWAGWRMEAG